MTLTARIDLNISQADYDRLCRLALRQNTTVSALVRRAIAAAPEMPGGGKYRADLRATRELAEAVEAKADASGMTTTAYVREAVRAFLGSANA